MDKMDPGQLIGLSIVGFLLFVVAILGEKMTWTKLSTIAALYTQYFENETHPPSPATLLRAATDAGIPEAEAKKFIEDDEKGVKKVKMQIREQASLGLDSVPTIIIEGGRRDLTLVGAKEVREYVKALEQIIKESK
jgi:predicted DsbA family dithiol-disulfide isomerase